MAECDICGLYFPNPFELGPHKKSCWNQQAAVLSDFTQADSDEEGIIITEPIAQTYGVPLLNTRTSQRTESLFRLATRQIDSTYNVRDIDVPRTQQLQPHMVYDFAPVINCTCLEFNIVFSYLCGCACRCKKSGIGTCAVYTSCAIRRSGAFSNLSWTSPRHARMQS